METVAVVSIPNNLLTVNKEKPMRRLFLFAIFLLVCIMASIIPF